MPGFLFVIRSLFRITLKRQGDFKYILVRDVFAAKPKLFTKCQHAPVAWQNLAESAPISRVADWGGF